MKAINGKRVRELREAKGWTRKMLEEKSGISERTIARIEGKNPPACAGSTVELLALALKVPSCVILVEHSNECFGIGDDELVMLGVDMCESIAAELKDIDPTVLAVTSIEEFRGKFSRQIDNKATFAAQNVLRRFTKSKVDLRGEDLGGPPDLEALVAANLDALDGTEHWVRGGGSNLYCTAVSFFTGQEGQRALRVSVVMDACGRIFYARQDLGHSFYASSRETFLVGTHDQLTLDLRRIPKIEDIEHAHVCTVARRPDHYRDLAPYFASVPCNGLYTYGGNPVLAPLAMSGFDAVFQLNKTKAGSQPAWDWISGLHIAQNSGCCVMRLDGSTFDLVTEAEANFNSPGRVSPGYIAATSETLGRQLANWISRVGLAPADHC